MQGKIIFRMWANCIIKMTHWIVLLGISFFNFILSRAFIELCLFCPSFLSMAGPSCEWIWILAMNAMTDCVCFLATLSKRMPWVHNSHCWEEEAGVNFVFGSHHSSIVLCKELVCICLQDNNCLQPRTQVERSHEICLMCHGRKLLWYIVGCKAVQQILKVIAN